MKETLKNLLGKQSISDNSLIKRMRHHQSWWRAFILNQEAGVRYGKTDFSETIGSMIKNGENSHSNFIHPDAIKAVKETLDERKFDASRGMISEDRLFNNLLSSQPLCFNFWGPLKYNLSLATQLIQQFYPKVKTVTNIYFEFAPNAASNNDNSAHDVAIEFISEDNLKGLIGMECKYTEPFSPKVYDKDAYKKIYTDSAAFIAPYEELIKRSYNQLFRNQLIVESACLNGRYDVVYSGLFCYEEDGNAITKGKSFQQMLMNGESRFKIITYQDFIETLQKISLDWPTRKWTMMLWARYIAIELSEKTLFRK